MKRDFVNLPTALMEERFIKEAMLHGIDGDIISGGLLSTGSVQTILEENVAQQYTIGTKMRMKDGRTFRYAKAGSVALVKGFMCQGPAVVANYTEEVQTGHGIAIALSEGNILITTGATPAANLFAEGWLVVNKGAGIGQVRKILTSGSHATIIAVTFEGALEAAIAATSEVSLIQNPLMNTIVVPVTTRTNVPIGVPPIAVTAAYYYWTQTEGPAPLIVDTGDTLVIGDPVGIPGTNAVAGTCAAPGTTAGVYGHVMFIATAAEPALVKLKLEG